MKPPILVERLNVALAESRTSLRASDIGDAYPEEEQLAFVERGHSSSEIEWRADLGSITATLWRNGVWLGTYRAEAADPIDRLARVLHLWCVKEVAVTALVTEFPNVETWDSAQTYEQGAASYVRYTWDKIIQRLQANFPQMLPIVELARARPELSALFPYLSHFGLRFSHFTGFPYSPGYPRIHYVGPGKYSVSGDDGRVLGEGSPEEVIELAVINLPPYSKPAEHGAEDDSSGA